MPTAYWSGEPAQTASSVVMPQWDLFVKDPQLRSLIETALNNNRDLRKALINVEAARAQFKVTRADRLPQLSANAGVQRSRLPVKERADPAVALETSHTAAIGLSAFELDLFGRVKSLSDSAFHEYLAQEQSARAARIALIAAVSESYLRHQAALNKEQLTKEILSSRETTLRLVRLKRENAQASSLDEQESEGQVEQARIQFIAANKETLQSGNALQLLLGEKALAKGVSQIPCSTEVLGELAPGLPSDLLQRRPDLMAAEHRMRAANADIGVARAAFFPQISLTAMWGAASPELSQLFSAENRKWQFAPQATLPLFSGGKNRAYLDIVKLRKNASIADYEQTVQVAFTEVNDSLVETKAAREILEAQHRLRSVEETALSNAKLRYETGVDGYPRLLDAQVRYSSAMLEVVNAWADLHASRIHLFKAIGADLPPPKATQK